MGEMSGVENGAAGGSGGGGVSTADQFDSLAMDSMLANGGFWDNVSSAFVECCGASQDARLLTLVLVFPSRVQMLMPYVELLEHYFPRDVS